MNAKRPLRNLGPVSRAWLAEVGIHTLVDLRRVGSVAAYAMIRRSRGRVTRNLLWALEGALRDTDWRMLTAEEKQQLESQLVELAD